MDDDAGIEMLDKLLGRESLLDEEGSQLAGIGGLRQGVALVVVDAHNLIVGDH